MRFSHRSKSPRTIRCVSGAVLNLVLLATPAAVLAHGGDGSKDFAGASTNQAKVIFNDFGPKNKNFPEVVGGAEPDTSYHLEAIYRYQVNDNIAITPGVTVITNPENNRNNDTLFIGTIRTTFSF